MKRIVFTLFILLSITTILVSCKDSDSLSTTPDSTPGHGSISPLSLVEPPNQYSFDFNSYNELKEALIISLPFITPENSKIGQ